MTSSLALVIFDCDGVLVDSEGLAVGVDALVLERMGWELSEAEIVERFVGRSQEFMINEIEAHLGRSVADGWVDELERGYQEAFAAELVPVDGIVDALDRIDVPVCVASSSGHERVTSMLDLTGLLAWATPAAPERASARTTGCSRGSPSDRARNAAQNDGVSARPAIHNGTSGVANRH